MLAASAHVTTATAPPGGDGASAPAGGVDGFTSALAALMAILGQPALLAANAPAPGSAAPSSAAPATASSAPAGGDAAVDPTSAVADATAVSDAAPSPATTSLAAAENGLAAALEAIDLAAGSTPSDPGLSPAGATPDAPQIASGGGPLAPLANPGSVGPTPDSILFLTTPPAAPALDPRLLMFVAREGGLLPPPSGPVQQGPAANAGLDIAKQGESPQSGAAASAPTLAPAPDSSVPQPRPALAALLTLPSGTAAPAAPPIASATPTETASDRSKALKASDASLDVSAASVAGKSSVVAPPKIATPANDHADVPLSAGQAAGQAAVDAQVSSGQPAAATAPGGQTAAPVALAAAAPNLPAAAAALAQAHGAEITAQLAAQIAARSPLRAFGFALEPQGLGRVDVSLKFEAQGQLSAVLSFENPAAASEARGRAADLQQSLQQAGFNVSQSGLSFTSGGGQGHAAWQASSQTSLASPPLAETATPDQTPAPLPVSATRNAGGLDITI